MSKTKRTVLVCGSVSVEAIGDRVQALLARIWKGEALAEVIGFIPTSILAQRESPELVTKPGTLLVEMGIFTAWATSV